MRIVPIFICLLLVSAPAQSAEYTALGSGYRFLGVPDFAMSSTFEAHRSVMLHGATLHYSRGSWEGHWSYALAMGGTTMADGFWQAANASPASAVWVEWKIGFVGVLASYTWRFPIWQGLFVAPSLGLGVSAVLGDIYATEVLPGCEGDVRQCGHWRKVTRHPVSLSNRLMPLVHAAGQLGYRVTDRLLFGIDLGLLNAPFVGLSGEYAL